MSEPRAFQRNAADLKQRSYAERKVKQRDARIRDAWLGVMRTREGRTLLHHLVETCAGIHRTPLPASERELGKVDLGLQMRDAMLEVSEDLYEQMQREDRAFRRALDAETEAVQLGAESAAEDGE